MRIIPILLLVFAAVLLAVPHVINSFNAPNTSISGLAYANGSLYALDGSRTVYKLNPATGAVQSSFSTSPANPNGIGYAGNLLYITNGTSNVYKYSLSGVSRGTTSLYCSG